MTTNVIYLENYIENTAALPAELTRILTTIKDLDERSQQLSRTIAKDVELCLSKPPQSARKSSPEAQEVADLRSRIMEEQRMLMQWADEKRSLAAIAADLVDAHIAWLDNDLAALESELKAADAGDEAGILEELALLEEVKDVSRKRPRDPDPEPEREPKVPKRERDGVEAAATTAPPSATERRRTAAAPVKAEPAPAALTPAPVLAPAAPPRHAPHLDVTPAPTPEAPVAPAPAVPFAAARPGKQVANSKGKRERDRADTPTGTPAPELGPTRKAAAAAATPATPAAQAGQHTAALTGPSVAHSAPMSAGPSAPPAHMAGYTPGFPGAAPARPGGGPLGGGPRPARVAGMGSGYSGAGVTSPGEGFRPPGSGPPGGPGASGGGAVPPYMPVVPPGMATSAAAPQAPGRLLMHADISPALRGRRAELYWPDDNLWYLIEIQGVDLGARTAQIMYVTGETEELNLVEIVREGHMSLIHA